MKFDEIKKLSQKKYRAQFGHYLVEGEHLVLELEKAIASQNIQTPIVLYVTQQTEKWASERSSKFHIKRITEKQMLQISDTQHPQGIVACVPLSLSSRQRDVKDVVKTIYLNEIQDPGNLGTIMRTLAWFGGFKLLLSPNCVDPTNPKVVRASMGAIFHLAFELEVSLETLSQRYTRFAFLDLQGQRIDAGSFSDFECYLFGNEARGVPRDILQQFNASAFTIAGKGTIDSLNVASAVNICAYQLSL